jgi:hypothetical protein
MIARMMAAAGLAAMVLSYAPALAVTAKEKMETCQFGADSQPLQGAARKSFISKCMANRDSPRGKPVAPRPQ